MADDPDATGSYGRLVCSHLAANQPLKQLLSEIETTAHLSEHDAGYVLGASTTVYCPQDLSEHP